MARSCLVHPSHMEASAPGVPAELFPQLPRLRCISFSVCDSSGDLRASAHRIPENQAPTISSSRCVFCMCRARLAAIASRRVSAILFLPSRHWLVPRFGLASASVSIVGVVPVGLISAVPVDCGHQGTHTPARADRPRSHLAAPPCCFLSILAKPNQTGLDPSSGQRCWITSCGRRGKGSPHHALSRVLAMFGPLALGWFRLCLWKILATWPTVRRERASNAELDFGRGGRRRACSDGEEREQTRLDEFSQQRQRRHSSVRRQPPQSGRQRDGEAGEHKEQCRRKQQESGQRTTERSNQMELWRSSRMNTRRRKLELFLKKATHRT